MKAKVFESYFYEQTGTIIETTNNGRVKIQWPNGDIGIYDAKKVVLVPENKMEMPEGDIRVYEEGAAYGE
jgi:hypothetical protein